MTLRELWLERRYGRQRSRDDGDRDLVLAWQITRIKVLTNNAKRLPDLRALLRQADGPQTPAAQRLVVHAIAVRYGLPLIYRPRVGGPHGD